MSEGDLCKTCGARETCVSEKKDKISLLCPDYARVAEEYIMCKKCGKLQRTWLGKWLGCCNCGPEMGGASPLMGLTKKQYENALASGTPEIEPWKNMRKKE